jgi:Flp pilus assembly protein TadD
MPAVALPQPVGAEERRAALAGLGVDACRGARARRWLSPSEAPPGQAYALGSFLLAADRPAEAERPLLAAAAVSRSYWEPHFDLGVLYQGLGLPGPAQRAFSSALALAPHHPALVTAEARGGAR